MCEKHYRRWWREHNKEHNKAYEKKHYEEVLKPQRAWKQEPKQCTKCKTTFTPSGKNQKFCTDKCRDAAAYLKDKEVILKAKKSYYEENKQKINAKKTIYKRNKNALDLVYRIKGNLRSRLNKAIAGNYKAGSAVSDLGCSIDFLKTYLESKFETGMTWENYGKWQIDHIKPLSSFVLSDPEELKIACNYINLQPMWAKDNLSKGTKYAV